MFNYTVDYKIGYALCFLTKHCDNHFIWPQRNSQLKEHRQEYPKKFHIFFIVVCRYPDYSAIFYSRQVLALKYILLQTHKMEGVIRISHFELHSLSWPEFLVKYIASCTRVRPKVMDTSPCILLVLEAPFICCIITMYNVFLHCQWKHLTLMERILLR